VFIPPLVVMLISVVTAMPSGTAFGDKIKDAGTDTMTPDIELVIGDSGDLTTICVTTALLYLQ
jgi:hypothetical protein